MEHNNLYDASQQVTCAVSSALQKMMGIVTFPIYLFIILIMRNTFDSNDSKIKNVLIRSSGYVHRSMSFKIIKV